MTAESPIGTSPTPETDGLAEELAGQEISDWEIATQLREFARKLERERDGARRDLDKMLADNDYLRQRAERAEAALAGAQAIVEREGNRNDTLNEALASLRECSNLLDGLTQKLAPETWGRSAVDRAKKLLSSL